MALQLTLRVSRLTGWKSLLVVGALVSWLGKLLLFDISDAADWFWYLFVGCWLVLFCLVWSALFRRNWRELGVFAATLTVTIFPVLGVGDEFVERVQDGLLRIYILHRIGAPPFDEFLSKCKLVPYVEDDGGKHTIGQCNDGLRSTQWFLFSVIYDPTGQFTLPSYRRSTAWRLAVEDGFIAGSNIKRHDGKHLRGDFYYIKVYDNWLD